MIWVAALILAGMTANAAPKDAAPGETAPSEADLAQPSVRQADKMDRIGPFEVSRKKQGGMVELTLTLARPADQRYRYEVVIAGSSNVRNAGQVGPSARIGAVLCRLKFSTSRDWNGTVTITDDKGKRETLRL